ncbi:uncharacterized protein ACRADG_004130 [Cochliomyia hominivorax]
MSELSEQSASKAQKYCSLSNSFEGNDVQMKEKKDNDDEYSSLWCIDDDTMFYPQGLKHHSAGKGKSVYVTWSENYLLNFVFKTSTKTGTTTLTKVRISMPFYEEQLEEVENMLILEMNTLLYMKSGCVYYFSSVKSMHKIDWLKGVRCMSSCPLMHFSVIRLLRNSEHFGTNKLCLEVYKDVAQLGKCTNGNNFLCHSYDISFDIDNLFSCDWLDENYTLMSLITDEKNITFLKQLISIGNTFLPSEDRIVVDMNQEVHVFTISGNIFILVGANFCESQTEHSNPLVNNYSLRLFNTYSIHIECVRVDCENNLLIVLLQSGHIDIWHKSHRLFDVLLHKQHQVSDFLYYDYWSSEKIFYFTTPNDIVQLKVITSNDIDFEHECSIRETRKSIGGMVACTWVENLKQLICLSFNNIFYRINFITKTTTVEYLNENDTKYEQLSGVYALNLKRIKDLTAKAQIVKELMAQPKQIHHAIEYEFQKQQILALASKTEILNKLFQCHLEYHMNLPGTEYFNQECIHIKTPNHQCEQYETSVFCLIFISLKTKSNFLSSVFTSTMWYLNISSSEKSFQLQVPYKLLNKEICVIINVPLKQHACDSLPMYSLKILSFINHYSQYICSSFELFLNVNEKTYRNIFCCNIQDLSICRTAINDIQSLIKEQSPNAKSNFKEVMDYSDNIFKFKICFKISKNILYDIIKNLIGASSLDMDIEIFIFRQYLIIIKYDACKELLKISSSYPIAIFYFKLILLHAAHHCSDDVVDISSTNLQLIIAKYQNDVEHLYGSMRPLQSDNINCNTISMHLENLQNIYLKLRNEFNNIFR